MNQPNNNKAVIALVMAFLIIVGGYFVWGNYQATDVPSIVSSVPPNPPVDNVEDYVGVVSSSTNGTNLYTNNKFGLRFTYPKEWRVGDNRLGYGTLQFLNFPESQASEKGGFPSKDMNKIEGMVIDSNSYGTSEEYPEKTRTTKQIIVAGQTATREEMEFVGGDKILFYAIPLSNASDEYLGIGISGDPKNFHVLDELVKSIEWIQ